MNIDFNKIAEFCVTKNQKKKIAILQKKFSFNNSKSREALTDLISSLFVNKIYESFKIIIPAILQVKFEEDFEIWGDVEYILGLLNESPIISSAQKKQSFELLKSVTEYKSQKGAQEGLDNYFTRHLSLYFVEEGMENVKESIEDDDLELEYFMRLGLLSSASVVKIICNSTNDLLEKQMNEIILKQIQALHEEKLLKYS